MDFQRFLQDIGGELQEILWWDAGHARPGSEVHRLQRELQQASAALSRLQDRVKELRERLAANERRARWLQTQVEVYWHIADPANAWRQALELDGLQRRLDQDRAQLQQRRQAYQAQLARVQQLQKRLDALAEC